jgi:hypothetical protein
VQKDDSVFDALDSASDDRNIIAAARAGLKNGMPLVCSLNHPVLPLINVKALAVSMSARKKAPGLPVGVDWEVRVEGTGL